MRLGFVSIQDASNVSAWSGIPFQILKQLRAQKVDVQVLSPLSTRAKYLLSPAKAFAKVNKSLTLDHFPFVLRAYAKQIERFVGDHSIDVVFSPSTIPITLLDCGKPIITWTDAVFHAMNDYYSGAFTNMTQSAVRRGKWQEETALRNCCIAAYSSAWAVDGARRITDPDKLRVLPFGSSLPVSHNAEDVARLAAEKRTRRRRKCELLFVGVDWERKGGAIALKTAELLNEAGIKRRCGWLALNPKVKFRSFLRRSDLSIRVLSRGCESL